MRLEHALVLNRYFHALFNARDLTELKSLLAGQTEGPSPLGQSYLYGALLGRVQDATLRDKLGEYDARVMGYEARLAKARGQFAFKYFQYLGLLYTEIFLEPVDGGTGGVPGRPERFSATAETRRAFTA